MVESTAARPVGELPRRQVEILQVDPQDWHVYKALKEGSVRIEPIAFGDMETELKRYGEREEKEWKEIFSGKLSGGRAGESIHLFAQEGALIHGMLDAEIYEDAGNEMKTARFNHLYVEPDRRENGTGRKLLLSMIEKVKAKGVKKVRLSVVSTQEAAIKLYESLGFKWVDTVDVKRGEETYPKFELELVL